MGLWTGDFSRTFFNHFAREGNVGTVRHHEANVDFWMIAFHPHWRLLR